MRRTLPKNLNLALATFVSLAILTQLFAMPVRVETGWLMAGIIIMLAPLATPYWSLIHEAIHRNFHSNRTINEGAGRFMSIVHGASFHVLRTGHLMHHQFNREWESEFYEPPRDNKWVAGFKHYYKLLGGLYISEVLTSFALALAPLPFSKKLCMVVFEDKQQCNSLFNLMLKEKHLRKVRIDCFFIILLYGTAFIAFKKARLALAFFLYTRALVISLMDNAYHYGTPLDNSIAAKELQTHPAMSKFMLNFNYHLTHHKNPQLSWIELAHDHAAKNREYSGRLGHSIIAQFKGALSQVPAA